MVRRRGVRARTRRSRSGPPRGPRRRAARGPRARRPPRSGRRGGPPAIGRDDPVGGLRRGPQQRDLVGVLDHPQLAQDGRREAEARRPARGPPGAAAGAWPASVSDTATRRRPGAGRRPPARTGSSVSSHVRDLDRGPQAGLGGAALEARHDEDRRRSGAEDEHRQPLERHRLVAGQVAQVRADADEQRVEPGAVDRRHGAGQPRRVARGRRRADARRASRRRPAGSPRATRRERRRPVLEQLAVGEDALRAAPRARACAGRDVVVLADGEDPRSGGRGRARSPRRRRRPGRSGRRSRHVGIGERAPPARPAVLAGSGSAPAARTARASRSPRSGRRRGSRLGAPCRLSRAPARGGGRRRAPRRRRSARRPRRSGCGGSRRRPSCGWRPRPGRRAEDDRVVGHEVADVERVEPLAGDLQTASRSVKMPTSGRPPRRGGSRSRRPASARSRRRRACPRRP